ncbi:hypothetical protein GWI33_018832 [Rhynchophorus ferrugineus]|uniref:Uncharacterized protein n=1 Tax=Rhynchophorus ferrugineus TaxID=354439 RepID=A0A834M230_RHYFE|nr:hypothetical protein GWI33_018832 [Rhynchophorus ferrugineus]
MLSPTPVQLLQPMSSDSNSIASTTAAQLINKSQPLGSTWANSGNVNIDLDNLMLTKPKATPSPSMNQLASNPTSPVNHPKAVGVATPNFGSNLAFNNLQGRVQQQQTPPQFFASFK